MTKVLAKGSFQISQNSNFVAVQNYILVENQGNKELLLRFYNAREEKVTRITISLRQEDARGNSLGIIKVDFTIPKGEAKSECVPDKGIILKPDCVDFAVEVIEAAYGKYVYNIQEDGELKLSYESTSDTLASEFNRLNSSPDWVNPRVKTKLITNRHFRVPTVFVLVLLSLMVIFSLMGYSMLDNHMENETRFSYGGVIYSFVNNNKQTKSNIMVVGVKRGVRNVVIPEKVKEHRVIAVGEKAFYNKNIYSLTIHGELMIYDEAFSYNNWLKKVDVKKVKHIGRRAFFRCNSIKELVAHNLEWVGDSAFEGAIALTDINISNSIKVLTIGHRAFAACTNLKNVQIDQFVRYLANSYIFDDTRTEFNLRLKNLNFTAPEGVSYLGEFGTVYNLLGGDLILNTLQIDYMDEIIEYFCSNINVKNVVINNLNSSVVPKDAFRYTESLEQLSLPLQLTVIGEGAFAHSGIQYMDGDRLQYIGKEAFADAIWLYNINLTANKELEYIGEGAFRNTGLISIHLPKTITRIEKYTFQNSYGLKYVSSDGIIQEIDSEAFRGCSSLRYAPIQEGTLTIASLAFEGCNNLESVTLPHSLQTIGDTAFINCYNLSTVINLSTRNIQAGKTNNGYVGYYALRVTDNPMPSPAIRFSYKSFEFVLCEGRYYLVKVPFKSGGLILPELIDYDGHHIEAYSIREDLLMNSMYDYVYIPQAVKSILPVEDVYSWLPIKYQGSNGEWQEVVYSITSSNKWTNSIEYGYSLPN